MKWASAIAEGDDLLTTLERCTGKVQETLGSGIQPTLATVFVHTGFPGDYGEVPGFLKAHWPEVIVLGCSAAGVIGGGIEIEQRPAVAITAGYLPDVNIHPFRVAGVELPSPDDPPEAWTDLIGVTPQKNPHFLLLLDPFSTNGQDLLTGLDYAFPGSIKVGGLASGGHMPGSHFLYGDGEVFNDGAVGVAMSGDMLVDVVVAQGCRPVGEPKRVTACKENILFELDGEPPLAYLQRMFETLSPRDQNLVQGNLFLGIAMGSLVTLDDVRSGDFLIRNLVGADQDRGLLAVGDYLREGQLVQFHVRDRVTSTEDLQRQLTEHVDSRASVGGALMFQCNGRGMHLYGHPNHDSDLFTEIVGPVPLGGFFCNGEIGPVGGITFVHGYTSSLVIFRER